MVELFVVLLLAGTAVLGWVTGMVTFRRSLRWCRHCGRVLRCPECAWPVMRS
jgi:hypothetical protein